MTRTLTIVVGLGLGLSLAACAERTTPASAQGATSERASLDPTAFDTPPLDPAIWTRPLGESADQLTSSRKASLAFEPIDPRDVGNATGIFTSAADGEIALEHREIAWTYDDSSFGSPFIIQEELVPTQAAVDDLTSMGTATPGCTEISPNGDHPGGTHCVNEGFSMIRLADGSYALLVQGPQATSVTWVESATVTHGGRNVQDPGVMIMVMGPAKSLSGDLATRIADSVSRSDAK